MENLIQQLKDNEKPFGLMSEEMQVKALAVGKKEFRFYGMNGWETPASDDNFSSHNVFRLRPDYEDEPEIVEYEIYENANTTLCYDCSGEWPVTDAPQCPDFIGFKFEDGKWYEDSIMPVDADGNLIGVEDCTVADIVSGRVKVLHATHVLFRRSK